MEHRNESGQLHREDGPAIERKDGYQSWWINGMLHRIDGPAIIWPNGTRLWYQNNCLHRTDGPAIEYRWGGTWYIDGHRIEK